MYIVFKSIQPPICFDKAHYASFDCSSDLGPRVDIYSKITGIAHMTTNLGLHKYLENNDPFDRKIVTALSTAESIISNTTDKEAGEVQSNTSHR